MCFLYLSLRPTPEQQNPEQAAQQLVEDPLAKAPTLNEDGDAEEAGSIGDSPKPDNPRTSVVLGSMDPASGFEQLLVFSSQGGSLVRAELVGRNESGNFKYRALEHKGGYLGHLSLDAEAVVGTVPDGSPAQLASSPTADRGIKVGDRIVSVNGASLLLPSSLADNLEGIKPGEQAEVIVERDGAELTFTATLSEAPLDVLRTKERVAEFVSGNNSRPSLGTTLGSLNGAYIPVGQDSFASLAGTLDLDWETQELDVEGGQGVEFRLPLSSLMDDSQPGNIDLVKRYRVYPKGPDKDGYEIDFETTIENRNEQAIRASFRQQGLAGLSLEGWWYSVKISQHMFAAAGQRDVIYSTPSTQHTLVTTRQIQDHAKDTPLQPSLRLFGEGEPIESRTLKYIGLDSQYFTASLLPRNASDPAAGVAMRQAGASAVANVDEIEKSKIQATNTSFWVDTVEQEIPPGGTLTQNYGVYIGPKDTDILTAHSLERSIEYGWFGKVAQPLGWILHFFHGIVGNYGIAIVMLTILVRGLMFPLGRKAAANAQRMQELQPELKKINDKYKDNMEKRTKAMQELYSKHNFKPLAGCLPMFIQLPIFMGLYRCLSVDISLRQEPLIPGISWCANLASPDMFMEWSSWMPEFFAGKGSGWLGPYFNILPIFTVVLFILQQQFLMPKATDDQTRMTQNMMKFMTLFMGVLFFKVPAGLCIYFITSSIWSLFERKLVKKTLPAPGTPPAELTEQDSPTNKGPGPSGKRKNRGRGDSEPKPKGRFDELKEMLEKPAVKSTTQRGPAPNRRKNRKKK